MIGVEKKFMIVKSVNGELILTLLLYCFFAGGILASDQKLSISSSSFSPIGYIAMHIEDGQNVKCNLDVSWSNENQPHISICYRVFFNPEIGALIKEWRHRHGIKCCFRVNRIRPPETDSSQWIPQSDSRFPTKVWWKQYYLDLEPLNGVFKEIVDSFANSESLQRSFDAFNRIKDNWDRNFSSHMLVSDAIGMKFINQLRSNDDIILEISPAQLRWQEYTEKPGYRVMKKFLSAGNYHVRNLESESKNISSENKEIVWIVEQCVCFVLQKTQNNPNLKKIAYEVEQKLVESIKESGFNFNVAVGKLYSEDAKWWCWRSSTQPVMWIRWRDIVINCTWLSRNYRNKQIINMRIYPIGDNPAISAEVQLREERHINSDIDKILKMAFLMIFSEALNPARQNEKGPLRIEDFVRTAGKLIKHNIQGVDVHVAIAGVESIEEFVSARCRRNPVMYLLIRNLALNVSWIKHID